VELISGVVNYDLALVLLLNCEKFSQNTIAL